MALTSLGPVFSLFGLYMSSRVDLLPVQDCLALAAIPDWAEATPLATVRALIAREFGCSPSTVYPVFEAEPCTSRLLLQAHRALLSNGKAVIVKVVHPNLQEQLACDLELLPVLASVFAEPQCPDLPMAQAMEDFRRTLQWQTDLTHETRTFEDLARDTQAFEMLRVPMVHKDLCSSQVSTIEQLPGLNLEDIMASCDKRGPGDQTTTGAGIDAVELARRLCLVWLRQALLGEWFPVAWHPENIVVLPNKQIAYTGGVFASLPLEAKQNLWNYLLAAANEDPDRACSCLLREMSQAGRAFDEDELRHRFRGIVPFRDGGWSRQANSYSLAEHLFVHWQLASERDLRPQHHLLCFYRGLFQTAASARRCAPLGDPLLEGLHDVRVIAMLAQFQETLGVQQLSDSLDKYTTLMMELPKRLDDALSLVAESHTWLKRQETGGVGQHRQNNSSIVVIALVCVLASVVLLSHHFAASAVDRGWIDRISALVFVCLGALLLRIASRTQKGGR